MPVASAMSGSSASAGEKWSVLRIYIPFLLLHNLGLCERNYRVICLIRGDSRLSLSKGLSSVNCKRAPVAGNTGV